MITLLSAAASAPADESSAAGGGAGDGGGDGNIGGGAAGGGGGEVGGAGGSFGGDAGCGEGGGGEGGSGGGSGGAGDSGGDDGGGCDAKHMERLKASSSPTSSVAAVLCVYTARAWRLFVPVSPRPRPMSSESLPLSVLRGSQVPVNGSALASVGKGALAPSLKQAWLRLVAVAPLREAYLRGETCFAPTAPPSQLLKFT
eukprot:scaffold6327_cov61-Phaeocystis_antarctica.AAC.1